MRQDGMGIQCRITGQGGEGEESIADLRVGEGDFGRALDSGTREKCQIDVS
jgi:hypothetical protein